MSEVLPPHCHIDKQIVALAIASLRYRCRVQTCNFLMAEDLQRQRLQRGWSTAQMARAAVEVASEVGENITLSQQAVSKYENKGLKKDPSWLRYAFAALAMAQFDEASRREYLSLHFGGYRPSVAAPPSDSLSDEPSWVSVSVPLPSEAALSDMFAAQLRVFGDLAGDELARALAKRLPSGLARLLSAREAGDQLEWRDPLEGVQPPEPARRANQQAPRR